MDERGCDYTCRTIGESITKYNIPGDWWAEFDACDGFYPSICIQIDIVRKNSVIMNLKLRFIENQNTEYAACMVLPEKKTVVFKIGCLGELIKAME